MKAPRTTPAALLFFAALVLFAAPLLAARDARAQARPAPTPRPAAGQAPKVGINAPVPAATPRPTRAPAAPLAGRVVGDAGEPLAGVPVFASSRAPGGNTRPSNTVTTDEAGNFVFPSLEPGLYSVGAGVPGYVVEIDPQTGRALSTFRPGDNAVVRMVRGGVITGAVVDQQGEPLVALSVRALRVRDPEGRTPQTSFPFSAEDRTDDRGVYRIYGLQPGVYVVFAGGYSSVAFGPATAYGGDVPTFYPSGTRDTAAEVNVRGGQETAGIDIRYRDEQGHRVTGTVDFPAATPAEFGAGLTLTYAGTGMPAGSAGVTPSSTDRAFSIEGVADGEYELQAQGGGREGLAFSSAPQRVSVRGADVTGVRLTLAPLASASGTLRIEPAAEAARASEPCKAVRSAQLPQETLITATPERPRGAAPRPFSRADAPRDTTPEETGDFSLRALEPARYRLSFRLFDESLYVRTVQLPGAAPNAAAAARDIFEVKTGQQLKGLDVRLAAGAASFGGRVAPAESAAPQTPAPTRVHLVPQERERAEDPLRYYEATVAAADGTFSFKNVAPGRYLLLARAEADAPDAPHRPAALDADTRTRLRREAEAAAATVELQPCQRTSDFALKYPQTK
ncbi:MAG TPA: carboxypeptidase-like regulatory domain-containing protein [Pyrinomonadaceae bacterium]